MGLTPKGKQLLNKVQSGQGNIKITKLKAGAGIYEEGEDYTQREDLKDPRQEFEITSKTVESDDSVLLVVKLTNYIDEEEYLETGYKIREMAFYADDPDDGEICYSIMAGTDDTMMDYMPAYDGLIPSVITNYYQVQVANAGQVEIVLASTESVYSEEGANGLRIYQSKMQYLDGGEWKDLDVDASNMSVDIDESSTVEGITDFPSFLATLVGKLSIFNTIRNFKAGLQFVLHMGQLVSNTSTNNANLPASAAAVYQNAQEIAALNTEMNALGIVTVSQKSEVSVADSTYTAVDSVTLSPGTYIVEVSVEFLSDFFSPSGARILIFRPGTAASYDHTNSVSAPPSRYTTIARTFLLKVSQEETYNVTVYQNSGEEATVNSCCRYVRLANV